MKTLLLSAMTFLAIVILGYVARPMIGPHTADSLKNAQDNYGTPLGPPLPPEPTTPAQAPDDLGALSSDLGQLVNKGTGLQTSGAKLAAETNTITTAYQDGMARIQREINATNDPALRQAQTRLASAITREHQRIIQRSHTTAIEVRDAIRHAVDLQHAQNSLTLAAQLRTKQSAFATMVQTVNTAAAEFTNRTKELVRQVVDQVGRHKNPVTHGA